jgi:hypothetical protein
MNTTNCNRQITQDWRNKRLERVGTMSHKATLAEHVHLYLSIDASELEKHKFPETVMNSAENITSIVA